MATPTLRPPVDSELFIVEGKNSRPWLNYLREVARQLVVLAEQIDAWIASVAGNSPVSTADVGDAAAITQNPISSPLHAAMAIPFITAADISAAPATYNSTWGGEVVTLANQMKAGWLAIDDQWNTHRTLTSELKTEVNALTTELQDTRTQLNAAIDLINEVKAAHNALLASLQ